MSYPPNKIPDAPMPLSMMPEMVTITEDDLLYLVQPNNNPGNRSGKMR